METAIVVPYRLKVRIGANEFDGEGPKETVREDYSQFLQAVASSNSSPDQARKALARTLITAAANQTRVEDVEFDVVDSLWNRAYKRRDDELSLHVLPQTDDHNADAIMLLIYGYHTLLQRESVSSTDLMNAAKQSGLRIDRIDRNIPHAYNAFIMKGGSGKGSRYSLTNPGLARAQSLLEELFKLGA